MSNKTIWTLEYQPFRMGGDLHSPLATKVDVGEPVDIGNDQQAFVIVSPSGKTFVAETRTGAIVGTDIEQVRKDVAAGDPEVIRQQLDKAAGDIKNARHVSNEVFWGMMRDG